MHKIPAPEYVPAKPQPVCDEFKEHAKQAASHLAQGFSWGDSAEGEAFWEAVYDRLYAISIGEPLK